MIKRAVTGRAFSPLFGVDQQAAQTGGGSEDANPFILNEAAARQFGWSPEDAIGRRLEFGSVQGWRFNVSDASGPVVGVVKDIHFESVHSAIGPTIYRIGGGDASLRISGREREGTLEHIVEKWREFRPELPVSPRFLEQDFEAAYETERRQAQLLTVFSALAVFIACLGLLGLVSFATEQRTKEIGVRKVMGGTVLDIVRLFTGEFARLVLIANVIAWPVAYVLIQQWLATFAYRIDPSLFHFVAAGLLALALAALTVATVAARAAGSNAIHALRYE